MEKISCFLTLNHTHLSQPYIKSIDFLRDEGENKQNMLIFVSGCSTPLRTLLGALFIFIPSVYFYIYIIIILFFFLLHFWVDTNLNIKYVMSLTLTHLDERHLLNHLKATCADFVNFGFQTFFQVLNTSDLMQVKIRSKSSFVISIGSVQRIHQLRDVKISP